jgi:hypothetical protein
MTPDATLTGLALIELVARLGSADQLTEYHVLIDGQPGYQTSLYLAGIIVSLCATTNFPLDALIDHERADALRPDN